MPLADNTTTATPGIYALDAHQGKVIGEKIDKIAKLLEKSDFNRLGGIYERRKSAGDCKWTDN